MFLNELLLTEDTAELKDIMAIAHYISSWVVRQDDRLWDRGYTYTLSNIAKISGKAPPKLRTASVIYMVYSPKINIRCYLFINVH